MNVHADEIELEVPKFKVAFNINFNAILEFKAEDMKPYQKYVIQLVMSYAVDLLYEGIDYSCFLVHGHFKELLHFNTIDLVKATIYKNICKWFGQSTTLSAKARRCISRSS